MNTFNDYQNSGGVMVQECFLFFFCFRNWCKCKSHTLQSAKSLCYQIKSKTKYDMLWRCDRYGQLYLEEQPLGALHFNKPCFCMINRMNKWCDYVCPNNVLNPYDLVKNQMVNHEGQNASTRTQMVSQFFVPHYLK